MNVAVPLSLIVFKIKEPYIERLDVFPLYLPYVFALEVRDEELVDAVLYRPAAGLAPLSALEHGFEVGHEFISLALEPLKYNLAVYPIIGIPDEALLLGGLVRDIDRRPFMDRLTPCFIGLAVLVGELLVREAE